MQDTGWSLKALPDMDEQQFLSWQELLEQRTGIFITEHRKSFLQSSLMNRMRELNCDDYQEYYDRIMHGPMGKIEWAKLIDSLTVQETRFFRDPSAFEYVAKYIAQNQGTFDKKTPLDIWSVGCSSGEEVYSLAMLANEVLKPHDKGDAFTITGTDISIPVLSKARQGVYNSRRVENIATHYKEHYFDVADNAHQITAELKRKTCFAQVNVLELDKVATTMRHIIYCQNVLIYFRRERRQEILNHLAERLAPGGVLLIGMGEIVDWHHPQLIPVKGEQITAFIKCEKNKNN